MKPTNEEKAMYILAGGENICVYCFLPSANGIGLIYHCDKCYRICYDNFDGNDVCRERVLILRGYKK